MAIHTCGACGESAGAFHKCPAGETGHFVNRSELDTFKEISAIMAQAIECAINFSQCSVTRERMTEVRALVLKIKSGGSYDPS